MSNKKYNSNKNSVYTKYNTISNNDKTKGFVAITHTLLNHKSFTTLTSKQKLIYIYMLDYAKGREYNFDYPRRIYKNICSNETFKTSIKHLEEHGLIRVSRCLGTKKALLFSLSEDWKNYSSMK